MKDEEPRAGATLGNSFWTASSTSPDSTTLQRRQHSFTPTTSGPPRSFPEATTKDRGPGTKNICKLRPQEEAHLVPDKHKIFPPDISDKRLALLGKMAAEKNSVLEWVNQEPSSSSAEIQSVDFPAHNHPATADCPPGDFSELEKGHPTETKDTGSILPGG